ncbi:hypothetical protein [Burkholderia sp. WSM2232]|uniref:hypothetical protein n=1 Tax=Burkholderia sp. WSM2232 TaxID=944436 RepID=UPI0003FF00AB|nr:hypothetical protein [Burkholderia sp. WSM2232]
MNSKAIAAGPATSVGGIEGTHNHTTHGKAAGRAALVPTSVKLAAELAPLRDIPPPQGPVRFSLSRKDADRLPVLRRSSVVVIKPGAAHARDDVASSWARTLPLRPVEPVRTQFTGTPPVTDSPFDAAAASQLLANLQALVEFTKHVGQVIHGAT